MLDNEQLLALVKDYLSSLDADVGKKSELDEDDYDCIQAPDGARVGFKFDVLAKNSAGGVNIADGYWRIIAKMLMEDTKEPPEKIKIVSLINHDNIHWTCSVTEIELDSAWYKQLREEFDNFKAALDDDATVNDVRNLLSYFACIRPVNNFEDLNLVGTTQIKINHYDTHFPGKPNGGYFQDYQSSVTTLIDANNLEKRKVSIQPKNCAQQKGNTCGDYAAYNGFVNGVLGLDIGNPEFQANPTNLRVNSEALLADLTADPNDSTHKKQFNDKKTHCLKQAGVSILTTPKPQPVLRASDNISVVKENLPSQVTQVKTTLTFQHITENKTKEPKKTTSADSTDIDKIHFNSDYDNMQKLYNKNAKYSGKKLKKIMFRLFMKFAKNKARPKQIQSLQLAYSEFKAAYQQDDASPKDLHAKKEALQTTMESIEAELKQESRRLGQSYLETMIKNIKQDLKIDSKSPKNWRPNLDR